MENIIKKQTFVPNPMTPTPLSMHKDSHGISKPNNAKPKIRIIHIFAPEIIKTDVANFRELVQRLTGKPTTNDNNRRSKVCNRKKKPTRAATVIGREDPTSVVLCDNMMMRTAAATATAMEMRSGGFFGLETIRERIKEEEEEGEEVEEAEIWKGANNGGFLNGFADFDGFIQELGDFPLMPLDSAHHHMNHCFEETHHHHHQKQQQQQQLA